MKRGSRGVRRTPAGVNPQLWVEPGICASLTCVRRADILAPTRDHLRIVAQSTRGGDLMSVSAAPNPSGDSGDTVATQEKRPNRLLLLVPLILLALVSATVGVFA